MKPTLSSIHADAQRAYLATLGPWIAAREARDAAQAHLVSLPKVSRVSRTQYHRGVSEISTASIALKQADRAWKEAKKVRYEALQEVWRAEWHLRDAQKAWTALREIPPVPGLVLSRREIRDVKNGFQAVITWTTGECRMSDPLPSREGAVAALRSLVHPSEPKKHRRR